MNPLTYRITIKPWYPSVYIERAKANTDKWEMVTNFAPSRLGFNAMVISEIQKLLSEEVKNEK